MEHYPQEATASTNTTTPPTPEIESLNEEVKAQMTITAKVKKAADLPEMEIERLRSELR